MILLDANVLIYAFRREMAHHARSNAWLLAQLQTGDGFHLHPLAIGAFLRLTTKNLGPLPAAPISVALDFLKALRPRTEESLPDDVAHLEVVRHLAEQHGIAGDGCTDLWLAAFAIRHRLPFASADLGFRRFQPELLWINPLA